MVVKKLMQKGKQKDNQNKAVKVILRERVLNEIKNPKVLDLFCGFGHMKKDVWYRAKEYIGIDKKFGQDNVKWLAENEVKKYNIFDLDAYSNPFNCLYVLAGKELSKGRFGIILTDYLALGHKINSGIPECLKWIKNEEGTILGKNRKYWFYHYHKWLEIVMLDWSKKAKRRIEKRLIFTGDRLRQLHYSGWIIKAI